MNSEWNAFRASRGKSYSAAHISGCIAAIVVMAVLVVAKRGGYLPASMHLQRLAVFTILAYGFVAAGMLWRLGRGAKRMKEAEEGSTLMGGMRPPLA